MTAKEYCLNFLTSENGGVLILLAILILIFIFSTSNFDLAGLLRYIILSGIALYVYTNYRDYYLFNPFVKEPKRSENFSQFSDSIVENE